jgi:hypothetical protein
MSGLDSDFIYDMLLYKLKWFLVHRFSNNGYRISDNELDSCRFIEIEFTRKIKVGPV